MSGKITYHLLNADSSAMLIDADIFDYPVDPAQLDAFVNDPGHELVFARLGSQAIGMASGNVMLHPDKPPAFFINEVGVNEDMRNQGIGAELSNRLMQVARDKGYQGIWLATEIENTEARSLYKKLNARETEGIVVYDWDGAMDE